MSKEGKMFSVKIFRRKLGTNSCLSQLIQLTPDINEHESCCWVNMNLLKSSHSLLTHAVVSACLWDILSALRKKMRYSPNLLSFKVL